MYHPHVQQPLFEVEFTPNDIVVYIQLFSAQFSTIFREMHEDYLQEKIVWIIWK